MDDSEVAIGGSGAVGVPQPPEEPKQKNSMSSLSLLNLTVDVMIADWFLRGYRIL